MPKGSPSKSLSFHDEPLDRSFVGFTRDMADKPVDPDLVIEGVDDVAKKTGDGVKEVASLDE